MNGIPSEALKQCTQCREWKDRSEFHKDSQKKDGLNPRCKKCMKIATHKWYEENTEQAKDARKKYKEKNPEYYKEYSQKNRDKIFRYKQREDVKIKARAASSRWTKNNPEKNAIRVRNWAKNNRKKVNEIYERWRRTHLEVSREKARKRRAFKKGNGGDLSLRDWQEILETYGNICLCCSKRAEETPEGKLTQDHIIPLSKGGMHTKNNIQPLCLTCNVVKGIKIIDYRFK